MQVEFKSNSTLSIVPENALENYALKKWFDGYTSQGEECLNVDLFSEDKNCIEQANIQD